MEKKIKNDNVNNVNDLLDSAENNVFEIFDNFQKFINCHHNQYLNIKSSIDNCSNNDDLSYNNAINTNTFENISENKDRLDRIFNIIEDLNKNLEESINLIFNDQTDVKINTMRSEKSKDK